MFKSFNKSFHEKYMQSLCTRKERGVDTRAAPNKGGGSLLITCHSGLLTWAHWQTIHSKAHGLRVVHHMREVAPCAKLAMAILEEESTHAIVVTFRMETSSAPSASMPAEPWPTWTRVRWRHVKLTPRICIEIVVVVLGPK